MLAVACKPEAGLESLAGALAAAFPAGLAGGAFGAAGALAAAGAALANLNNGGCPLKTPKKDLARIHLIPNALIFLSESALSRY